jgi:hypothetical protein
MAQPFRVIDGDDPGRDRGGWDENGNVDLPGILTVNTVRGSGSSTPALTTVTFEAQVAFLAAVAFTAAVLNLTGATAGGDVVTSKVTGDSGLRFALDADGSMHWGDGTALDALTDLYRGGSGVLRTDAYFQLAGGQADGDFTVFGTNLTIGSAGGKLRVKEGTNASMGRATLVAGTVVVNTTLVTANSEIFLTCQTPGGTPGFLRVSARSAGTSFTILSSSGTDTSVVSWLIVEPAP